MQRTRALRCLIVSNGSIPREFPIHAWPRVNRISRTRSSALRYFHLLPAPIGGPASIATGRRPIATLASGLNKALERCISNLFPRLCHASLGPAYLSDGHLQYPYLLVHLSSCAKRAFGSFAGSLQLLLTAKRRRICVDFFYLS